MSDQENELLRSTALQNASSILLARRRAEMELVEAKDALRQANARLTSILESITDGFAVVDRNWRLTYLNPRAQEIVRPLTTSLGEVIGTDLWETFPGLVGTEIEANYRRSLDQQVTTEFEVFFAPLDAWFEVRTYPAPDALTIYFQDISRRKDAEALLAAEKKMLELIATGAPLDQVLETLALEAEAQSRDGMLCSVLLLDADGERLLHGAAPSLPPAYNEAIHGVRIGPDVGSCGTAAFTGQPVFVTDIANDPRWRDFTELAAMHRLGACCSTPITSSRGDLLGTIAMYFRQPHDPGARDRRLIDVATQLAAFAIERKRGEDILREREARLRATFQQAAVGIAMAGLDGRFIELNEKFCAILGYSASELQQLSFVAITHPEDRASTQDHVSRLLAGDIADFVYEKRYVRKDGAVVWSLTTVTLLRDAENQPQRFIGVIEDITQRKRAEEALRHSEEELRALANSIPQLAWMAEADGNIFWYNRGWFEYTGTTLDQMQGWGWQSVHDPQMLPLVLERWQHSIAMGLAFEMEFPLRGADGVFRWFLTRVNPVRDAAGRVIRWFGTNTDVDQVKRMHEALQDEKRVLELLNNTGIALASNLEHPALLQSITDAATQLSGAQFGAFFYITPDENGDALLLYTLSGAPREAFEKFGKPRATALFGPTFKGEGVIRCDDVRKDPRYGKMSPHHGMPAGHLPVCSYLAVPVASRSGEVIGGLFFGHSEPGVFGERHERLIVGVAGQAAIAIDNARLYEAAQKAAEERTRLLESERSARAEAERMSAMKDEFLATLSHELRTPLNAMLGWSQILRRGVKEEADLARGLETIERNARVQTQLIEDLLDMSRITSGKLRLDIQPVDPFTFIEAAVETVRPAAEAKGVRIDKLLDPAAGPISGDPGRLQQVVWNLLSNAIKFTPKGGKVQILLERVNSNIGISVADTGSGIDPEFLPYVFERFRQADASTTRSHGGLGLGLSIVKHLVELHGGAVYVKSPGEGLGTTFTLHLPLAVVHRAPVPPERAHPGSQLSAVTDFRLADLTGVRVLVVDDEPDARSLVQHVLIECHATVFTASSAEEALRLVETERPQVLVSDIGMPGTDGYALLARVRGLGSAGGGTLPAIALTAFARSEDRTRALRAGFLVHVAKPVEPSELVATVASVVGRTGPQARGREYDPAG